MGSWVSMKYDLKMNNKLVIFYNKVLILHMAINEEYSVVDWGTTSLRAYRVINGDIVEEIENNSNGVLHCNNFEEVLTSLIGNWNGCIYLIGMIGSRIGWKEVDYAKTPAGPCDVWDQKLRIHTTTNSKFNDRQIYLIPGVKDDITNDVMRGEETQIFGTGIHSGIVICPGTHSKWVRVKEGKIKSFTTFMSGELFTLLKERSIISKSINDKSDIIDETVFLRGALDGYKTTSFLSAIFQVRIKSLLSSSSPEALHPHQVSSYLSGVVIGSEIREGQQHLQTNDNEISVVGNASLIDLYAIAIKKLLNVSANVFCQKQSNVNGITKLFKPNNNLPRVIAILRGITPEEVSSIATNLVKGGIRCIEVPLNSPFAIASISILSKLFSNTEILIGAGTVLTVDDVRKVKQAGGSLIVSPNVNVNVISETCKLGLVSVPGFYTATEAFSAIAAGCNALKYFPAESASPASLKALRAVLPPHVPVFAVGGISLSNISDWKSAGAYGYGIGTSLFKPGISPQTSLESARRYSNAVDSLFSDCKL